MPSASVLDARKTDNIAADGRIPTRGAWARSLINQPCSPPRAEDDVLLPELTGHRNDKPGDLGNRKGLAIHDEAFCGDLGEASHGARSVHTADQRPIAADRNGLAEDRDPGRRRRRASRSRSQSCAPDGCAPGAKVDCHSLAS